MLFAGSAYSELPISTTKEQEFYGEEFYYNLIIDRFFNSDLEIQQGESFELNIAQNLNFDTDLLIR